MGRVARAIAAAVLDEPGFETTLLLERSSDAASVRAAFAPHDVAVRPARDAGRSDAFDVVWFPWNGMRYRVAAPALLTVNDAFAFTFAHKNVVARRREQEPIARGVRAAARIVTPSRWSRAELVRTLDADPASIDVVPYAPDPQFTPADADGGAAARFVLLVGARERRKNARTVIEACATAFVAGDSLVVVGDLAPDDLRRAMRLTFPHRLLGHVDDAVLLELYRSARVVAVPSLAEGYGLVAVEAMACGAAVVAADFSALTEACEGGALILDPLDAGAWGEALSRILRDDGLHGELVRRGTARIARVDRAQPARDYLTLLRRTAAL